MNCATPGFPPYDLRDYYFDALPPEAACQVREHLPQCPACAAELEQWTATTLALRALPDEEIPRRIAFVSDKIFQPSAGARWFQSFWASGARLGASAAMLLAGAILVHAYRQPAIVRVVELRPAVASTNTAADRAAMQTAVNQAVAAAVSAAETRYDAKLRRVIAENEKQKRDTMDRVATVLDSMDRRNRVLTVASNSLMDSGQ